MDPKISFAVFGVVAIVTLVSESVKGEKVMLFKKPFFSSDIKNSKTFKDQFIVPGSDYPPAYTKSFNGSRYKFVESCQGLTRSAAQSDCERDSSHLVFIETKEENDFLVREASHDKKYWIGLFSPKRHLFWDNGHQVTFGNFDARNENNFNDRTGCYKMTNDSDGRYWLGNPCEEELGFICEYGGSDCPYDTKHSFNNSCYKFVNDSPSSRLSAKLKCINDSSHLVFIESKEENDFLVGKAQRDTEYWIGLHDRPQLFWDDGNKVTFTNIDEDERATFNGRTGCYRVSGHKNKFWYDRKCDWTSPYICEYKDRECSPAYNKSFNGSCYKFVESSDETRDNAQLECDRNSSHLVFIETKKENDFLVSQTSPSKQYWIGLLSPKRHLFWDDGHQVTYVNLVRGSWNATFDDKTSCYKMSSTDVRPWLDKSCTEELAFICEYDGPECMSDAMHSFSNSCYNFVNDFPASRLSAKLKCENDNSHLVFIESKEENNFLVEKAQNGTEYWIGLHDRPQLFWDDGKEASYTNIDAGQDDTFNGRTGCYLMSDHQGSHIWVDKSCNRNFGYICEYEG